MKSTVETLSPTRVRLAIEVPFAELEPSVKKAYREIGVAGDRAGLPRRARCRPKVIDQRVGRGAVLNEAVQDAIPHEHHRRDPRARRQVARPARGRHHRVLRRRAAEVHRRGRRAPGDHACRTSTTIEVTVDELQIADSEVDEQLDGLRERFATLKTVERPAATGDYVQIDLAATVDGVEVPGGSATNISHEVGSNQLLPGLDEALRRPVRQRRDHLHRRSSSAATSPARTPTSRSPCARSRRSSCPPLDDDFAQLASEFDTLDELRGDLLERITAGQEGRAALRGPRQGPRRPGRGGRRAGAGRRRPRGGRAAASRRWPTSSSASAPRWRTTWPPRTRPRSRSTTS